MIKNFQSKTVSYGETAYIDKGKGILHLYSATSEALVRQRLGRTCITQLSKQK